MGIGVGGCQVAFFLSELFGRSFSDIFSGFRVFSRRFVKSFPVLSSGFEIETEISVHALELKMPVGEVETVYAARPEGSHSKLSTVGDGWRILKTIITLYRVERPWLFFGMIATVLAVLELAKRDPRWPVDAILDTGDIVQDESRAGYERFRAALEPLGVPVYSIPGNHDDPNLMSEILMGGSFQLGGELRNGAWSVVLLSTFLAGEDAGGLGPARIQGLRRVPAGYRSPCGSRRACTKQRDQHGEPATTGASGCEHLSFPCLGGFPGPAHPERRPSIRL